MEEAPEVDMDLMWRGLVDTEADAVPEADVVLPETSVKLEREREREVNYLEA